MKKVIIFDFDGVIVDSFSLGFNSVRNYNNVDITANDYRNLYMGNFYDLVKNQDTSKPKIILDPQFFEEYSKELIKINPIKNIDQVIKKIAKKGISLFIISSSDSNAIRNYLKFYKLDQYFSEILGCDVEKSKVIKFNMILDKTKVDIKEVLFITDTIGDILEASKVGIETIGVTYGFHNKDILLKSPTKIPLVDSPKELIKELDL